MAKTAKEWAAELQDDPCVSYWLKEALTVLFDRDPLDALRDADLLHRVMQRHEAEVLNESRPVRSTMRIWDGKRAGGGTFERGE